MLLTNDYQYNRQNKEEDDDRRWWFLVLLLLLIVLCGLFCSAQFAIWTGTNQAIPVGIVPDSVASYGTDDQDIVIPKLNPTIIFEATANAKALKITPESTSDSGVAIVQLPSTNTATPVLPTPTNTPRPTFTHTPTSTPTPSPTVTPEKPTSTPRPLSPSPTNTVFPPTVLLPNTPTPIILPDTPTPIISTNTPIPLPPTNTPIRATDTPRPSTNTPAPATNTPIPSTNTPIPATNTPIPAWGVVIEPDYSSNADPGTTVRYTHIVTNTGNVDDNFSITANSSQNFMTNLSQTTLLGVASGEGRFVSIDITIPATFTGNITDTTLIIATSDTDTSVSDFAVDITVINSLADVIIEPDNTAAADLGDVITYTHIVTNIGNSADSFNITASSDHGFATTVNPGTVALNQGQSTSIQVMIQIPITSSSATGGFSDTTTVTAVSVNDSSRFDTAIDITYIKPVPPSTFILNAANGDDLVSLGWVITSTPAMTYEILYTTDGGTWQILDTNLNYYVDYAYHLGGSTSNGITYYYQVKAFNAGAVLYSNIASATPNPIVTTTTACVDSPVNTSLTPAAPSPAATCADVIPVLSDIDSPGDGDSDGMVFISAGGQLILDYGPDEGIVDGPGNDLTFYEWAEISSGQQGINLNYVQLELSETGSDWTLVFGWDGLDGHVTNTTVAISGINGVDEVDMEFIPVSILIPDPSSPPPSWNTGISIDIWYYLPAGIKYRYVRLTHSAGASAGSEVQVDAVYRIN